MPFVTVNSSPRLRLCTGVGTDVANVSIADAITIDHVGINVRTVGPTGLNLGKKLMN